MEYPIDTCVEKVPGSTQKRCRPWDFFLKSGKSHSDQQLVVEVQDYYNYVSM